MSTLCVTAGTDSFTLGYCCVAIGNGAKACGGFQVVTKEPLTLPDFNEFAVKQKVSVSAIAATYINNIQELVTAYKSMSEAGNAPKDFGNRAEKAIAPLLAKLKEIYEKSKEYEESNEKDSPANSEKAPTPSQQ